MDKPREKQLYRYGGLPVKQRKRMFDFDDEPYVCVNCIDEPGLRDHVESRAISRKCDFCGKGSRSLFAAPLVEIASYIEDCLFAEYDHADNCLSYDSREGGYLWEHFDTRDLISSFIDFPNDEKGTLLRAICDIIGDNYWCKKNPYGMSESEELQFSWEEFSETIKFQKRYFFLNEEKSVFSKGLLSPGEIFAELTRWIREFGLIVDVPSGGRFLRARYEKYGETLAKPSELGPPRRELATQPNRMSPPGIVMLYASDDAGTALRETANGPGTFVVGEFETEKLIRVLDLTKIPDVPSLFEPVPDSLEYNPRPILIFLQMFAVDLAKPIARDDRVHIEYVPTQVVTEFIRTEFNDDRGNIDGLRYGSSRHLDHSSLVLFASQQDVHLEDGKNDYFAKPWLRLVDTHRHEITQADLDRWEDEPKPPSPENFI
jgi:hypothetical protein